MDKQNKTNEFNIKYYNDNDFNPELIGKIILPNHIIKYFELQHSDSFTLHPIFNVDNKLIGFTSILSKTAINPPQG